LRFSLLRTGRLSRQKEDPLKKQHLLQQENTPSPEKSSSGQANISPVNSVNSISSKQDSVADISPFNPQKELQETRDKFILMYDYAPNGYVTLDREGLILEANLTLANLLGVDKSLLPNSAIKSYLLPGSREIFENNLLLG